MATLNALSSHQRILQMALQKLQQHESFRGRTGEIRMDERDGRLILRGRLPSFYLKQLLQSALRSIEGVREIDNQVEVSWPPCP